jgi:hypothetical protein
MVNNSTYINEMNNHLPSKQEEEQWCMKSWLGTRRSGGLLRLNFNEIAQFLSKSGSFSCPVSLQVRIIIFLPIIILFLQCSHKRSLKFDPFRVWCSIFYSKLVNCILFKIIVQHVCFLKDRGSGERNVKIWIDFRKSQIFPHFALKSRERRSSRPVFSMCGEPGNRHKHVARLIQLIGPQCFSLDNWQ